MWLYLYLTIASKNELYSNVYFDAVWHIFSCVTTIDSRVLQGPLGALLWWRGGKRSMLILGLFTFLPGDVTWKVSSYLNLQTQTLLICCLINNAMTKSQNKIALNIWYFILERNNLCQHNGHCLLLPFYLLLCFGDIVKAEVSK